MRLQTDPQWLDAQYNNRARVPEALAILERWKEASAHVRAASPKAVLDQPYGDGPNETLDIFPATTPAPTGSTSPVLVFIHGGYWRSLDKSDHSFVAPAFTSRGATVVVPNYALCPAVTVEAICQQVATAVAWTARNIAAHGGDPERIAVAGHSAGGHLAAMLISCRWKQLGEDLPERLVPGALGISGLYDLEPLRLAPYLQQDLQLTPQAVKRASPAFFPRPRGKFHAVAGMDESEEFLRQNRLIRDAWGPTSVPVCETLPGLNHFTILATLADPAGRLHHLALRLLGAGVIGAHEIERRLLANLNPEQHAAVTAEQGAALILAGAGSGKTRVLTTRIAWLIATGQVSPGGVLAVTFTNKAAKEMLTRLGALLPVAVRGMWIGTFHGLCNRFLRAHWKTAGLPQGFQILDSGDQQAAVKRVIKAMNLDEERFVPKQVSYFIAGNKEEGLRAADVEVHDPHTRTLVAIYSAYDEQCRREGVVDFGELMLRCWEVLRDEPAIREHYRHRFAHLLVDEFQDTNRLQYLWLKMLAPPGGKQSVFAVGDDDQSIYAFRGARVGNMADFEREYAVRQVVKLEQNYRSFGHILDAANGLIEHNSKRLGKNLRTDAGPGEPVRVYEATSDYAEAQWLLDEMQHLHRGGIARAEMAVLYRSNAQSRVLESALFNAGVPYRVYGGLRFFERAEVKHALAYLRLIENANDDTSFLRVVNFPARGIGARSIELLQDAARAAGSSLAQAVPQVSGRGGAALAAFVGLIDGLRSRTRGMTLREIIERTLEASGLVAHYRNEKEGGERIENLEELVNAAESFVTQEGFGKDAVALPVDETGAPLAATLAGGPALGAPNVPDTETGEILSPLAAFLAHASLEAGDNQAQAGADAVQLMTIHSAKGLEFDAVFITGIEEGLFPHDNSVSDPDGLEEERRLMYVAITRARQRLYLSFSQTRMLHGQTRYGVKSRFFDELPEGTLKWLSPKQQGFGSGYGRTYADAWSRGSGLSGIVGAGRVQPSSFPARPLPAYAAPVPAAMAAAQSAGGLRVGQSVFHTKFGEGVVITLEGQGSDARAQVNFGRHGAKWLALSIAKLTPIESQS